MTVTHLVKKVGTGSYGLQPIANKDASNTYLEKKSTGTYGWSTNSNTRNLLAKDSTGAYGFANISFAPQYKLRFTVDTGTTKTFTVPTNQHYGSSSGFGSFNIQINWGDGSAIQNGSGTATSNGGFSHTYAADGIYDILINGSDLRGIGFAATSTQANSAKVIAVAGDLNDPAFYAGNYSSCYRFYYCTNLTDASELILPSRDMLSSECVYMFAYCNKLVLPPVLPSTTMGLCSYMYMFQSCGSLYTPPALPATTLGQQCYYGMFNNSGITMAPTLPATELSPYCYGYMFSDCSNLWEAPELPAQTLTAQCYYGMFSDSVNLTGSIYIGCSTTTSVALPSNALTNMCRRSSTPTGSQGITAITGHVNFRARLSNTITAATGGATILTNQTKLINPRTYTTLLSGWK
jgi:hypothetical protein